MPQEPQMSSHVYDSFDFSGFSNGYAPPSSPTPQPGPMAPPSAYPSAFQSNMPEQFASSPSTRNASFMSQASSQSNNTSGTPQTPIRCNGAFGGSFSSHPSPHSLWINNSNAAMPMTSAAWAQNIGTNDFDFDFSNVGTDVGAQFDGDGFNGMAEFLANHA